MRTAIKIISVFLFISFLLFPVFFNVRAQTTGERVRSFDSSIQVNKDGTIDVKETILYDFDTLQKHGIIREIPFIKKNKEGKKHQLDIKLNSITDETGKSYPFSTIWADNKIKWKTGVADLFITGLHTYVISYRVSGALTYFSDHDELFWNVNGNDGVIPIEEETAIVTFPQNISDKQMKIVCFTGISGSTESACKVTINNGIVSASTGGLKPQEGMTISVSFPKNVVAVLEPKEYIGFFETLLGKIVLFGIILALIFWYVLYPIKIIVKWFLFGRDPSASVGQTRAWFDPPKSKTGRPFSPAEVGSLVDESVDLRDFSGMIVNLAQRGYFKIVEKKKSDFYFVKEKQQDKVGSTLGLSLQQFEKQFLDDVFKSENEVRLKDRDDLYQTVNAVSKQLYESMVTEELFPKNPQAIRQLYNVIAGLAFFTFNIFLGIVALVFGRNMPRKTAFGVESVNIGKSLKNFLSSQERQLEFQAKNQMMFEKLLPYAIVFGVEKIWAKRFEGINMRPPDWYEGRDMTTFNSIIFANSLSSSLSSFRSAASPPSSTTSSSGFSSGFSGGSSGGGGGGGGVGSW